jgi:hypothetical protein
MSGDLFQHFARELHGPFEDPEIELARHVRVVQGAMGIAGLKAELSRQGTQRVLAGVWDKDAGQFEGVDAGVGGEHPVPPHEAQVEHDIVADHDAVADHSLRLAQRIPQRDAFALDHLVGDAGQFGDLGRDVAQWVNEAAPLVQCFVAAEADNTDFDDRVSFSVEAGRFQVEGDKCAHWNLADSTIALTHSHVAHQT